MPQHSITVFLHSKVEPRLSGHMLFVWCFRIAHGESHVPLKQCYQDIGVRSYGPIDDKGLLQHFRKDCELDALSFYSNDECVPFLIRSRTKLNPKIVFRVERV